MLKFFLVRYDKNFKDYCRKEQKFKGLIIVWKIKNKEDIMDSILEGHRKFLGFLKV